MCGGRAVAAGGPERLKPIPEQSAATPPSANGQSQSFSAQEETVASDGEECMDFCGLPLCSPPGKFWLRADYLMWWTSGMSLPPLVTTSPQGTPQTQAGVLPGATILYGNDTVNNDGRSGFRTTLGLWLDACHVWGVEFDYLNLGERDNGFTQTSLGNPILARPFFSVANDEVNNPPNFIVGSASQLMAFPGVVEGTVTVDAKDYFQSAGVLVSYNLCSGCGSCGSCDSGDSCGATCGAPLLNCCRADLLAGFRYYNLSDRLTIHESLRDINSDSPTVNSTFDIHDRFSARNDFYGGELGLRTTMYRGRWSLDVLTKIALGNNHQTIVINGDTTITAPNQSAQVYDTGILAGPNNIGTYERDVFTMIPQLGVELGYQVTCHLRAFAGYNILYWGCVSRAADQIDLNLDPRNFPPPLEGGLPFPAFPGKTDCFWAQGVNVGGEFRF